MAAGSSWSPALITRIRGPTNCQQESKACTYHRISSFAVQPISGFPLPVSVVGGSCKRSEFTTFSAAAVRVLYAFSLSSSSLGKQKLEFLSVVTVN
ncbi:hypothetical protein OPV22_023491 [Ensete ventricosum]|uniref:Uncharacterized protein n=1 Tax=Ensete ventricosum TaxID=4639 RepID=A0AAV8QI49_ENSVE|nr:hypothetical protein OPV22_023491 [Ensete ventricosum]